MMKVLAIESSGRLASIGLLLVDDGRIVSTVERQTPSDQRTARSLLPTMHDLLQKRDWKPAEIDLVAVTTGPGSFTGLRIGVVAAKTFAYATRAKLVGVHTLAAIAVGVDLGAKPPRLWTILDAQRQELFVASFDGAQSIVEQCDPPTEIVSMPAWLGRLAPGDAIAGPPLAKLRGDVSAAVTVVDEAYWTPHASAVGRLGYEQFTRGQQSSPLELAPRYFRRSAAEEKAAAASLKECAE